MKLAYLINQYPMTSFAYIRREIAALEDLGVTVSRFSLQPWTEQLVDESDRLEAKKTRYVKSGGCIAFIVGLMKTLFLRPRLFAKACVISFQLARASDRSFLYHVAYLAEACILRDWLVAAEIDHLHVHFGTNGAEIGMLAHVLGGPRYSVTFHGPEEFDRTLYLSHHEKIKRSAFVVAVSSYGRSQLMRTCGTDQWHKLKVVHCCVDSSYLESHVPRPLVENSPVVCVGRLIEQKGHLLLIQAVGQLVKEGHNIQLRLVGDGPMRPECEAAIHQYDLAGHVVITGWATGEQVRNEILGSQALVLASFAEGLPVVLMEALALERPVLSTYIAGIPELISPGENGWLVPAGSVDALVTALRELISTPVNRLREMGTAGRRNVLEWHNAKIEATKLLRLFRAAKDGKVRTAKNEVLKAPEACEWLAKC